MTKRLVAVNARGYRLGECHQLAILTDAEVDLIREMREMHKWTYDALAEKFEVSKSAIAGICRYERRAQAVARWKQVVTNETDMPARQECTPENRRHP